MMRLYIRHALLLLGLVGLTIGLLTGCGDNDNAPVTATYRVELLNLTANQPLSPVAVILHGQGYSAWQLGQTSGDGLEQLAEGGDPTVLLQEATANAATRDAQAGVAAIPPGTTATIDVTGLASGARLTVASMLVNTNDCFTGTDNADLTGLAIGAAQSWKLVPYDSGTENNGETAGSIPGPAGGGEGFNAIRDDRDYVAVHPGVVSADDGLAGSALNETHRFQNPVAKLVVTRIN